MYALALSILGLPKHLCPSGRAHKSVSVWGGQYCLELSHMYFDLKYRKFKVLCFWGDLGSFVL